MKYHFLLSFIILALLCTSCKKEQREPYIPPPPFDPNELPAATQEGLNTFGCKINGKVWRPRVPTLSVIDRDIDARLIESSNEGGGGFTCKLIDNGLNIDDWFNVAFGPTLFEPGPICDAPPSSSVFIRYRNTNGKSFSTADSSSVNNCVFLTKIDTSNNIFSGTFQFKLFADGVVDYKNNDIIEITEGVFDLKYNPE